MWVQGADKNSLSGQLWHHKVLPYPDTIVNEYETGFSQVLSSDHFAFLGMEDSCQDTLQNSFTPEQVCKVLALPKTYLVGGLSLGVQKFSPYREIIEYR